MAANIKKKRDTIREVLPYNFTSKQINSLSDNDVEQLYLYHVTKKLPTLDKSSDLLIYACTYHPNIEEDDKSSLLDILTKRNYPPAYYDMARLYSNDSNPQKAEEYYSKGSELGNHACQLELANMYENSYEDFDRAEKYYRMADAYNDMCSLVRKICYKDKPRGKRLLLELMKKKVWHACEILLKIYYKEKEELDDIFFEFLMYKPFRENLPPILQAFAKIYEDGIEYIDLHFKYSPGEKGAEECKKDFMNRLIKKN